MDRIEEILAIVEELMRKYGEDKRGLYSSYLFREVREELAAHNMGINAMGHTPYVFRHVPRRDDE